MKKVFLSGLIMMFSAVVFAEGNAHIDLSIGSSIESTGRSAILALLDDEFLDNKSFPGLQEFFNQELSYDPSVCVKESPIIDLLTKEFIPTGTGGGYANFIYVQKITCGWEFTTAKAYRVNIEFEGEGSNPNILEVVSLY